MNKKVNTITFHGVLNHGAVLQAYALQSYLMKNGFDSELMNYKPWYFIQQVYRPAKGFRKTFLKIKRIKLFNSFSQKYLKTQKKISFSLSQLSRNVNCDAVICGSDQIWNKNITNGELDKAFLLDFLSSNVRKIAFAASAGGNCLSNERAAVLNSLASFDSLGVREEHLRKDIVDNNINVNAKMVLDPTFLIQDYADIIDETLVPSNVEYILSYEVSTDKTRMKYNEFVKELKFKTGLPVYHIGDKQIDAADFNVLDISPSDWVAFVKNAKMICTNSFHGTAFSINFEKPFVMVSHVDESRNARPLNLLKMVDLEHCFYKNVEELERFDLSLKMNFNKAHELIDDSKSFLLRALKGI